MTRIVTTEPPCSFEFDMQWDQNLTRTAAWAIVTLYNVIPMGTKSNSISVYPLGPRLQSTGKVKSCVYKGLPAWFIDFPLEMHFIHHLSFHGMTGFLLSNSSISSNHPGDYLSLSAMKMPKAKPRRLPSRRNIGQTLIAVGHVDTALRDSAFGKSLAAPQVLRKTKNNVFALLGQLFFITHIPVCIWLRAKIKSNGKHYYTSPQDLNERRIAA